MWLLKHDVAARYESWLKLCSQPTEAQLSQLTKFAERREAAIAARSPECLTVAGDVAQISVCGVLTPQPDFWAWLFYGENTSYAEIREALGIAGADPNVKRIAFHVDSPGGHVAGLFETLGAIEAFDPSKKRSVTASLAASAAYAIAAVAGTIEAVSPASEFGSVGVVRSYYVDETLVEITSTEAPNKRPDPTTEEGKAVIRGELDAIHDLFVDAIARGRTRAGKETDVAKVNAEFGRGGVLLARAALSAGMIDKAPPKARAAVKADHETGEPIVLPATQTEQKPMDLEKLKAEHPALYKAVVDGAKTEAITAERDRVAGHLTMGETSGDMKTAIEAIKSGEGLTVALTAKYMAAGMNRKDIATRGDDAKTAAEALDGAKPVAGSEAGKDLGDEVVALLEKERGVAKKAS
jgi:ClpP class serine protease